MIIGKVDPSWGKRNLNANPKTGNPKNIEGISEECTYQGPYSPQDWLRAQVSGFQAKVLTEERVLASAVEP